jgi:hypothetical protein
MTIWEKAVLNIQRGVQRVTIAAIVFSERVRAEIAIVRFRIRINEIQARIDELYQGIGRKVVALSKTDAMPKTTEQLLQDLDIAAAREELFNREKEIEDLNHEIRNEQVPLKTAAKQGEDKAV